MTRKPKIGALTQFIARDPHTRALIRDANGRPISVSAYTSKAAKHQAKAIAQQAVIAEPAS